MNIFDQLAQMKALEGLAEGLLDKEEKPMPTALLGTVIVFKETITPLQAAEILNALSPVLESDAGVQVFDPKYGGPVWYIP